MRPKHPSRAILTALLFLAARAHAGPQAASPVDQGVADLDPLSTSYRHIEPGLSPLGQGSALFALPSNQAPPSTSLSTGVYQLSGRSNLVYYRVGQGYRARVDRINYLVRDSDDNLLLNQQPRQDGEYREIPGPNTVFDLSPFDPLAVTAPRAAPIADRPPAFEFNALIDRRKTSDRQAEASLFENPTWPSDNPHRPRPTDPLGRRDDRIDNRVDNRLH